MSIKDYEGGIITKNPTTPTGPYQDGVASGVWTMDEAAEYTKQGVWPTAGNISPEQYVDGLFSTYLYEGNGTSQTITNNLDLAGKGGLVWIKSRPDTYGHRLIDTARGVLKVLESYDTTAEATQAGSLTAFNSNGFDVGNAGHTNFSGNDFVSWSFLKKPGFFDVVTYTGDGSVQSINHNLGSVPACMIVKRTDSTGDWYVYHVDLGVGINGRKTVKLNSTAAQSDSGGFSDHPTNTAFTVNYAANTSGATYVAYLFASDDARFGDNKNESIIKCGSFTQGTTSGSTTGNVTVNLGFEPQWLLIKNATSSSDWVIYDVMRGVTAPVGGGSYPTSNRLRPNSSASENNTGQISINATGFTAHGGATTASDVEIYIAIRRPMITPTAATEVFTPIARTGTGATAEVTGVGFSPDMLLQARRTAPDWPTSDRLRGVDKNLGTPYTQAETTPSPAYVQSYDMDGVTLGSGNAVNGSGLTYIEYFFKRAPGFFDVVAYTGDGATTQTLNHNLGVTPELMIAKRRNDTQNWVAYHSSNGAGKYYNPNTTSGVQTLSTVWGGVEPTSTQFTVGNSTTVNFNGDTYIAYLFATLAGISKVGSYTGTAANLDVDCGFTAGARFILIKRTDSTGDWYIYDSVRGIAAGNDPYLLINSTAAEVTGTDYIDPLSSGFTVTSSAPVALNASGGTYIFLAIA